MKNSDFLQPTWPAPANVKAFTSLKPSAIGKENVKLATDKLKSILNLPYEPIFSKQTHSDIAIPANVANPQNEADALYAHSPNQICAVLTADCLPLLVTNQQGTEVAAIHAGWRGLGKGVIENTIAKLTASPQDLLVWLGPAIGPNKFAVREDVVDFFIKQNPENEKAFHPINSQQWLANIYDLATFRLQKLGITNIFGGEFCTYSDQDRFYSYRRDGNPTGRMVSLIWFSPH